MPAAASLSFRAVGQGFPIVFIHGWQMDGQVEALDFEPISRKRIDFRRIYVDLPGMGASATDGIRDLGDFFERLVGFLDQEIGTSRFLLVGTSCGGYLARAIAGRYSASIDGLLLRVPLIETDDRRRDLDPFQPVVANPVLMSGLPRNERDRLGEVLVQTPEYIGILQGKLAAGVEPAIARSDAATLDTIRSDPDRYRLQFDVDSADMRYAFPTLIITGRHDESVGYRDSLRLLELYPRATFAVLDRGRHSLPIDERPLFNALVVDWITRVAEYRRAARPSS